MLFQSSSFDSGVSLAPVPYGLQMMSDHKTNETNFQEKLLAESDRSKSAEGEKELLREQIVELRKVSQFLVNIVQLSLTTIYVKYYLLQDHSFISILSC